jgi:hypothetical protein
LSTRLRSLRIPLLALCVAVTAWLGVHAANVGVEHDNESLRTTNSDDLRVYRNFRDTFGSDEDVLVAIGYPRLLGSDGLTLIAQLTDTIGKLDGVSHAWSLTDVEEIVKGSEGAVPKPLLVPPWTAPGIEETAAAALDRNPDFTGWLVSEDRKTAGIVVQIEDRPNDNEYRSRLVSALRAMAPLVAARGGELHLTGVPVQKIDVSAYVDRDQKVLLPAAAIVLGLTLALFFRHISGVVVPLAVSGLTVVWTIGTYSATGHSMNAITALLPPVLLVIALAMTVHVYDAWLAGHKPVGMAHDQAEHEEAEHEDSAHHDSAHEDRFDRAYLAVRSVFVPGLLCAVTTAQGFVSLSAGDLPAVGQFGFFAAYGTFVAFVMAMTVAPAALSYVKAPPHRASDEHGWTHRFLSFTSGISTGYPITVITVFTLLTVVLSAGIPLLRSNTDLVGFLRADAPLRIDTTWIDDHLTGTLPLDFMIARRDGKPVESVDEFRRLAALEDAIRAREHVAGVTSVTALVRQVHRAESGSGRLELPSDEETLQHEIDLLDESGHSLVRHFAAPEMKTLRMTVRLHAVGSAVSSPLVAAIRDDAARILGPDLVLTPTGSLWQVVRDSENLVQQQVQSFGWAIVLVVLAIGILLRSVAFTVIAMIPNVMPILWTGGFMGFVGIELSTGTAMIASAVLGLIVDDTIHYLSYYRGVYRGDPVAATRITSRAIGAPVTVSSTALVLGFWVGAFGSFRPTIYFSLLTGLTMITGIFCDLLVLPASLVLLDRLGKQTQALRQKWSA